MTMGCEQLLSLFATVLLAGMLSGCAATDACYEPTAAAESLRSVYVVKRAWHTGVAVAAADWPNRDWSVLADFPHVPLSRIRLGRCSFLSSRRRDGWLAIRAAFFSNASALHVIGFDHPTPEALIADEVIEVRLSGTGTAKTRGVDRGRVQRRLTQVFRRAATGHAGTEQVLLRQATLLLSTHVQLVVGAATARWRLSDRRVVGRLREQSDPGSERIRERA